MIDVILNKCCTGCDGFKSKLTTVHIYENGESLSVHHTLTCEYKDDCDVIKDSLSMIGNGYCLKPIPYADAIELDVRPYCESCTYFEPEECGLKITETGKYRIGCRRSKKCSIKWKEDCS